MAGLRAAPDTMVTPLRESNPYARSAAQALTDLQRLRRRSCCRSLLRHPLALTDALLYRLEDLLAGGHKRVPGNLRAELYELAAAMPRSLQADLRVGVRLERLMDETFRLQEELLMRMAALDATAPRDEADGVEEDRWTHEASQGPGEYPRLPWSTR